MAKITAVKAPAASAPAFTIEVGAGAAPVDEGAYSALIAAVLDLGVQAPPPGGQGAPRRQIAVGFELLGATSSGAELPEAPVMFRRYGLSFGPKAELPKLLRAVLGRDPKPGEHLAPAEWIGKPVSLTVEHTQRVDGSASARIASVTRNNAKGLPALTAEPLLYPGVALTALPEWAVNAIGQALTATAVRAAPAAGYDHDLPQ